ncbi:MAG: TonB dependent receptor [Mucilaginibacter sp.]|nr:TonB dependent receptor [Mucilaginibacter sp.]
MLVFICLCNWVIAQPGTITGRVIDETNRPLPGATVHVKGTDQSTVTDVNGKFTFPGNNQSAVTIVITFIGYDAIEKAISTNETTTIQLVPNQKTLSEVVVIGYGTAKKNDLTGAVASISSKDLNPGSMTNPLQELSGKAAGVNVTEVGSEPGVAPSVRIRGITSLSGGNDPLVVVDGIQGDMTFLNQVPPSEIASINILKDASATAIYGSRGAPGVIIITTKKGVAGKTTIEYIENTSLDVIPKELKELNGPQWTAESAKLGVDISANHGSNTDWYNLLTRNGVTQNHTLAFGGGANEFTYRASLSAIDQTGVVINSNYKKYIGRIVATQKALDDRLTLTMNLNSGINDVTYSPNGVGNAAFTSNTISQAYIARPTDPVYNTDGSYYSDPNVFHYTNPYAVAKTVSNTTNQNELFGSLRADLDITKDLSAGWFGSWRKTDSNVGYYAPAASTITDAVTYNGIAHIFNDHTDEKLTDINLTYKHDFGKSHFDATAVYEYQIQTYNGDKAFARGFVNDLATYNALQLGNLADVLPNDIQSYKNDRKLVSYLGRINYSYNSRYYLTASFRSDGSSVFGANHQFGYFPSASLAWRIDQEDFMKNQKTFSTLKLRGGYGSTGNQQGLVPQNSLALVGLNTSTPTVYFGGQLIPNYTYTQNYNPDLKWETRKETNVGLDFGLFDDRLTGTIDAYTSKTENLLFNYAINESGNIHFPSIYGNAGTLQNQGLELSLSYTIIRNDKVTLTLAGNGSLMQNKVLKLSGIIQGQDAHTDYQGWGATNAFLVVGKPIGTYLIYKHTGVDANGVETVANEPANGVPNGAVQNNNERFDEGQVLPKYNYAFTPSFTYKNFDASMVWRGAGGNKVYDGLRADLSLLENIGKQNVLASAIPLGIHSSPVSSDEWLESGNYLRFENLSLGYRFNVTHIKFINALRVSVTGQNLALITKYKGLDPEVDASGGSSSGGDYGIYPRTRTFSVGLNVILK